MLVLLSDHLRMREPSCQCCRESTTGAHLSIKISRLCPTRLLTVQLNLCQRIKMGWALYFLFTKDRLQCCVFAVFWGFWLSVQLFLKQEKNPECFCATKILIPLSKALAQRQLHFTEDLENLITWPLYLQHGREIFIIEQVISYWQLNCCAELKENVFSKLSK